VSILRKLLAIALVLLMQGPAMLVQEVAWVNMLITYTQDRGLKRGVMETFDGDHPCDLCLKAAELRENENKEKPAEQQNGSLRFRLSWAEMVAFSRLILPAAPASDKVVLEFPWRGHSAGRGVDAPVPPPPERV
jgi:hypothetical protein